MIWNFQLLSEIFTQPFKQKQNFFTILNKARTFRISDVKTQNIIIWMLEPFSYQPVEWIDYQCIQVQVYRSTLIKLGK